MISGTEKGFECCLRAKIDMQNNNKCLRDPVIYRCNSTPHIRTLNKYNVYPTYDFACPVVDSLEGVTHVLRTNEYRDRKPQFEWFCRALNLRVPVIHDYSRLNMMYTVMSKRKLTWFVENKHVDGWDDPRFPTVKGILRRGLTVEGLKAFIGQQGASRSDNLMEWDKIWAVNKSVIDPIAPRYMAVDKEKAFEVTFSNGPAEPIKICIDKHPKNASLGKKELVKTHIIYIEGDDAVTLKENEKVTLKDWGNAIINRIDIENKSIEAALLLEDKDYKETKKLNWVALDHVLAVGVEFDHLITKRKVEESDRIEDIINPQTRFETELLAEPSLLAVQVGDLIQVIRRGYFRVDSKDVNGRIVLFNIPDGRQSHVSSLSTKTLSAATHREEAPKKKKNNKNSTSGIASLSVLSGEARDLHQSILKQGYFVRRLKEESNNSETFSEALSLLFSLKSKFNELTGLNWDKNFSLTNTKSEKENFNKNSVGSLEVQNLLKKIEEQSNHVRVLKTMNSSGSEAVTEAVELLLSLKSDYKKLTEKDHRLCEETLLYKNAKEDSKSNKKSELIKVTKKESPGITFKKEENFSDWYSEVIKKADLISSYPVTGCFVLRPNAFSIWERITKFLDDKFKSIGVQNCYFPMFVRNESLQREATNFTDFAPEVAWVTKCGNSEFSEPVGIRPTSEAVMYPSISDWIQSHRDLPLKLNQWCNVVRWEFKDAIPFLRTREFLWQEGHSAFECKAQADEEVLQILEYYQKCYEELLAIPVIPGRKSEKEKFAGGLYTTTLEGYIAGVGRAIQGATSHCLGQNFSKIFDVHFIDQNGQKQFVWQNSWGFTTRSIGITIMTHSDDTGFVCPPFVAEKQVVVVPCGLSQKHTQTEKLFLYNHCRSIVVSLIAVGVRAFCDLNEHVTAGKKFYHWELRGIPVRIEVGFRDLKDNSVIVCIRFSGEKRTIKLSKLSEDIPNLLKEIHNEMLLKAKKTLDINTKLLFKWDDFVPALDNLHLCLVPWCQRVTCEEDIKTKSTRKVPHPTHPSMGAKSLCTPFRQPQALDEGQRCINCDELAKSFTLFGRSY